MLNKQKNDAKNNFNYFFMSMIIKIFKCLVFLLSFLLINLIFDILVINIITLIFTIYTIFKIYGIVDEYNYILNDIRNTFNKEEFNFIIDYDYLKNNLFKGILNYEK